MKSSVKKLKQQHNGMAKKKHCHRSAYESLTLLKKRKALGYDVTMFGIV